MTPTQRAAALRLADALTGVGFVANDLNLAAALLRELLAEPEPAPGYCKHCKQYTIEQPLPAEPDEDAQYRCGGPGCDGNCCQPVQEPVALMWQHEETGRVTFTTMADPYVGKRWHRIPLYAHPPQQPMRCPDDGGECGAGGYCRPEPQQRKPLTEDFINDLGFQCGLQREDARNPGVEEFARALERGHGITGETT